MPFVEAFRMGKWLRDDTPDRLVEPLTRVVAQHLLDTVKMHFPEHYSWFLLALRSGLRLGELAGLQWGDIDLAGRFPEVRRNVVAGKITTPKNTKRRRVDLSVNVLKRWRVDTRL